MAAPLPDGRGAAHQTEGEELTGRDAETSDSFLDRLFLLLDAFDEQHASLSLGELVVRTGMPKTTVYRLGQALVRRRVLEHVDRRYQLGPKLFELGELVPRVRVIRRQIKPFLRVLREETQGTVGLGMLDGDEVLYLLEATTNPLADNPLRDGQRIPAHCTAIGKAILAFSDPALVDRILATGLPRYTTRTVVDPARLRIELSRVRSQGYAAEAEEYRVNHFGIAAPVLGPLGHVIAAMSVEREDAPQDFTRHVRELRAVARRASLSIDWTRRALPDLRRLS
ncbi:IclR family transcriptional regulator [Micromonospora sp. LZ34]